MHVEIQTDLGARIASLCDSTGYEWLWKRQVDRTEAQPGDPFIDAGGIEECFPTIAGPPDHGEVWSRPWNARGTHAEIRAEHYTLDRSTTISGDSVVFDYRLTGESGYRFIWAQHALFDPKVGTHVQAPTGTEVLAWPGHVDPVRTRWPNVLGMEGWDTLGDDDGSAMFAILTDLEELAIRQAGRVLRIRLTVQDQPHGFAVWRNLGGYPWDGSKPYRNFGIEPLIGHGLTPAGAGEHAGAIPASGELQWSVSMSAEKEPQ